MSRSWFLALGLAVLVLVAAAPAPQESAMPAPSIAATGPLARPYAGLAKLLAATDTYQAAVEAANPGAVVLDTIDYPYRAPDSNDPEVRVPGALITDYDGLRQEKEKGRHGSGQLVLHVMLPINPAYTSAEDQLLDYLNQAGAILSEMEALANTPAGDGTHYWNLIRWEKLFTPQRSDPDDYDQDFYAASFIVEWV